MDVLVFKMHLFYVLFVFQSKADLEVKLSKTKSEIQMLTDKLESVQVTSSFTIHFTL